MATTGFAYILVFIGVVSVQIWINRHADAGGVDRFGRWIRLLFWPSVIFQVLYGTLDLGLGVLAEHHLLSWAASVRGLLGWFPLALTAWVTDLLASWGVYYFFVQMLLSWSGVGEDSRILAMRGSIGAVLLMLSLGFLQSTLEDVYSILMTEILLLAVGGAVLFWVIRTAPALGAAIRGRQVLPMYALVCFPLLEPLLGNALQFVAFASLFAVLKPKHCRSGAGMDALIHAESAPWQRSIFIYLLSIGFPMLLLQTAHMTMLPPFHSQFQFPVTVAVLFQIPILALVLALLFNNRAGKVLGIAGVVVDLLFRGGLLFYWGLLTPAEGSVIEGLLETADAIPLFFAPILLLLIQGCIPVGLFLKSGFAPTPSADHATIRIYRRKLICRMIQKVYCWLAMTAMIVAGLFSLTEKLVEKVIGKREQLMVSLNGEVQLVQVEMIQLYHQMQPMFWTMIIGFGVLLGAVICSLVFDSRRRILKDVQHGGGAEGVEIFKKCLEKGRRLRGIEWMLRRQVFPFVGAYILIVFWLIYPALLRVKEICYAGM